MYKRSEMCLFIFYQLFLGKEISIKEMQKQLKCSRNTCYLIISDIELFIADFYCYELEIIKKGVYFSLSK